MKIAVIAADGRSGRIFVEAALARGHSVRAGIYKTNPFKKHDQLEAVTCNATRQSDITALIDGCDAVVSLIGHARKSNPDVQTIAIKNAIQSMSELNMTRLVSLTGTGVRLKSDIIPLIDKVLNVSIKYIDPARIRDGVRHAETLQASDLDYTIIRVLKLGNGAPKPFTLRTHGPAKLLTPRSEVAAAILEVLEHKSFIREMPVIGEK